MMGKLRVLVPPPRTLNDESLKEYKESKTKKASDYKAYRPLSRIIPLPVPILCPYMLLVIVRIIALILTLAWRLTHPNKKAIILWGLSVTCEFWFGFAWLLDQLPKLRPINRETDLPLLGEKFHIPHTLYSDLPPVDVFVTTADPLKEPPLTTANTVLSILAADYPPERLTCYVSDDGASYYTYNVMVEVAKFAESWVPFCRKHDLEPRNPDTYFTQKKDPLQAMVNPDFVHDYDTVKKKYGEFRVLINSLPSSDRLNKKNERAHWNGAWSHDPVEGNSLSNHDGIVEVMLNPKKTDRERKIPTGHFTLANLEETTDGSPLELHTDEGSKDINFDKVTNNLPMLVYLSREKRPGFDHHKKAGSMNAMVRASAILSNGAFILNLDCDHYINNSRSIQEAICFMMDRGGDQICYVQFPQKFDGIDPSDRYANKNTVFFDIIMKCLDGIQGPFYVGTGCLFRRVALYGIDPPDPKDYAPHFPDMFGYRALLKVLFKAPEDNDNYVTLGTQNKEEIKKLESIFGNSELLVKSFPSAEVKGLPLADHPSVQHGRKPGDIAGKGREEVNDEKIETAIKLISCWFEEGTQWGNQVGWIYGSLTEDVLTGYTMHNRGWKSVYCNLKRDAFRGSAPINLTDRLQQVLRWATGSVEIFFSYNNAFYASSKMMILQRISYINLATYPFTSVFLTLYCYLPAISLLTNTFIMKDFSATFLGLLLTMTTTLTLLAILEIKWSGITLEQYWRNQQFWLISGTSAHLFAVLQGLLKVLCNIEIKFEVTAKSATHDDKEEEDDDPFSDLYKVKWTKLMIPHILILVCNTLAVVVAVTRGAYSTTPMWGSLIGGVFFSCWVVAHLYPFILGLKGKGDMPGIVFIWAGIFAITISLLWVVQPSPIPYTPNFPVPGILPVPVPGSIPYTPEFPVPGILPVPVPGNKPFPYWG